MSNIPETDAVTIFNYIKNNQHNNENNKGKDEEKSSYNYINDAPPFQIAQADQHTYPRFTEMVKSLESYVRNNSQILKAVEEFWFK